MTTGFDWDQFEPASSAPRNEGFNWDQFEPVEKRKAPHLRDSDRGKLGGGVIGAPLGEKITRAVNVSTRSPSSLLKELPVALSQGIENLGDFASQIALGPEGSRAFEQIKQFRKDEPAKRRSDKRLSEVIAENMRQGLSPEESQGRQDIADIEEFVLSVIPLDKLSKLVKPLGLPKKPKIPTRSPPPGSPPPGSPPPTDVPSALKSFGEQLKTGQRQALAPKVTEGAKDIPFRPSGAGYVPSLEKSVGEVLSPSGFKSSTVGGKAISQEVQNIDKAAWSEVNKKYQKSRKLNEEVIQPHPELVDSIEEKLMEIEKIPVPAPAKKELKKTLEKLRKSWRRYSVDRPISNQDLINQIQELRSAQISYEFQHGDSGNIFKPLIADLEQAVERAAAQSNNPKAIQSLKDAKEAYKDWAENIGTDYMKPLRDRSNKDFSKNYLRNMSVDEAAQTLNVLKRSKNGQALSQKLKRDFVQNKLGKHYGKGIEGFKQMEKELAEMEGVILSAEESDKIRSLLMRQNEKDLRLYQNMLEKDLAKAKKSGNGKEASKLEKALSWTRTASKATKAALNPSPSSISSLSRDENIQYLLRFLEETPPTSP